MRRLPLLVAVVVVGGGAAAFLLTRPPSGPFPSESHLRMHGFAAWPVDTAAEAEEECADAREWRLDERATALRFAEQVLRYPKPHTSDWGDEQEHRARFLVGSDDAPGVFLGSVLELSRFGRCWYVVDGTPREGDVGATVGFVYRDGRAHLLLGNQYGLPGGFVGFGDWATEIARGLRQHVMWMPKLDPNATGHAIYASPDKHGVSEAVGIDTFGSIPPPPEGPPSEVLHPATVVDDRAVCRSASAGKSPERVIRYLYRWTFDDLLRQRRGYAEYERKEWRHLGGDRWRLIVDDAVLTATIPEIAGRCYELVSLVPVGRDPPLRRLWIDEGAVTFGVDWGGGDEASLSYGTGFGFGWSLKELAEPVTFPQVPSDDPRFAGVTLYKRGHVVSAFYGPLEAPR